MNGPICGIWDSTLKLFPSAAPFSLVKAILVISVLIIIRYSWMTLDKQKPSSPDPVESFVCYIYLYDHTNQGHDPPCSYYHHVIRSKSDTTCEGEGHAAAATVRMRKLASEGKQTAAWFGEDERADERVVNRFDQQQLKTFVLEEDYLRERDNVTKLVHTDVRGCWESNQSMDLEHPPKLEKLAAMDPENQGIITDLLGFARDKEFYKRIGKAWKRGYLLLNDSPGTDRSSLIAAMANFLEFDIYHLDLASMPSISELRNVLFLDGLLSTCGDEQIIVLTTNHRDLYDAALLRSFNMDIHVHTSSPQPAALPDGGEIVQLDSSEQKPLLDFDATNNSAYHCALLVSDAEAKNMREESNRRCVTESVHSLVDSTARRSSTHFDPPDNGAHLVMAHQTGPIGFDSEKKDIAEGLNGECFIKSGLSLDYSTKRKLRDFDATGNKEHLVRAYQTGPVVSLPENENRGESECVPNSMFGLEDLQKHCGGRRDVAAKSFDAIYDLGFLATDSTSWKSFEGLEILPPQEQPNYCVHLLSPGRLKLEGCVQQEKSPDLPRVMQINRVEPRVTKSPTYLGKLTAQPSSSSCGPIGLPDGGHIVLLDPLEQSTKNVPHAARTNQCSPTMSLPEGKRKWATRKGYSLGDQRLFEVISLSMDEKLDSRLLIIHISKFARSSPPTLALPDGGEIAGPIASSLNEFSGTKDRPHFVRQDQSGSTASHYKRKNTRETPNIQGITMSLCSVQDLQQHGWKHKDVVKRLDVNISMFKNTCRQHRSYWWPCWTKNNDSLAWKSFEMLESLPRGEQSNGIRHLVRQRTLTYKHCVRRKKSQDLPQSLQMDSSGGLATQQSTRSLHWPLSLPDGEPIVTHSENIIVRNTFKRKCRSMSVSFEDHQQHFCSRCEGAANSLGAKRICKLHGINLVSTAKRIHRQHGIHRCPFRQGYSLGGERPAEVISLSTEEKLVSRLQFVHMSWLARSSLHPFALRSGREIEGYIAFSSSEFAATNNQALPGGQDRRGSSASRPENERTKETKYGEGTASSIISREVLQKHFGSKREDVAKILGFSVSTFKRVCRDHGIPRWPNWRSNSVRRPPDPHVQKNPSPTFNTPSTYGQITLVNEMGGQNSEPNECLSDSFEDRNFQNTGNGSIAEFEKTPTFDDSFLGHCRDVDFCYPAVYSETEAAQGSSKWAFQLEGQTTQSTAYPNRNALVFPQSQMASTEVLNQNMGSSEERRDLLASQVEAYLEGHGCESSSVTFPACSDAPVATILHTMPTIPHTIPHLIGGSSEWLFQRKNQSTQFTAYPNPNGLADPHPQMASTQKISENIGSLEDRRNLLAPQKEPLPEGHVFGSVNWTVGSCSSLAPSQPMPTIPHTTGISEYWRNSFAFAEGHLSGGNLYGSFNLTVPPCSDPASQPMPTIHHTMATIPHKMPLLTERPNTRSMKLKAIYGDTTIKFQLPLTSGINELKEEVSKILECKLGSFNVEYKDEDGDWILMASDENLSEYLQLLTSLGNQVTKLKLRDKVTHTTNFCDNCGCDHCRSLKQKRP
ncbi:hypothetical protein RHMOL_Rhmol05G0028200 [Rhododendron molle]|uniref:Uncharacterized protein n=1 Tax=Rhododendron molle TaxID=49168 RepID=A0ACC0NK06_RHOML|nr:hypothetical protein RHMOL_Rhmol05G0028200 [Rhododendron molle]